MTSVESDIESVSEGYLSDSAENGLDEAFEEEEIADELQDESTTRLLRDLGEGLIDADPLRLDLQQSIDTELFQDKVV